MKTMIVKEKKSNKLRQNNAAKVAGWMFLFNLIIPTLGFVFIQSRFLVKGDPVLTISNVMQHKGSFYFGMISELFLSVGLVALGYSLYLLVRHVNKDLAFFAFIVKCVEATIMTVITLISFLAMQMISNTGNVQYISSEQIQSIAGFLLNQHEILNSIPIFFLGLEMVLFNVLLIKSGLIPRVISGFGVISFILIFIYSILSVSQIGTNLMLLTLPSFLFELICGCWLLIRGIKPATEKI